MPPAAEGRSKAGARSPTLTRLRSEGLGCWATANPAMANSETLRERGVLIGAKYQDGSGLFPGPRNILHDALLGGGAKVAFAVSFDVDVDAGDGDGATGLQDVGLGDDAVPKGGA